MLFHDEKNTVKAIPALHKLKMLLDANKNHMKNSYTLLSERVFPRHSLQGSMTVEASLVLSLVIFVWMACVGWTSLVYVHTSVQEMLIETARDLSVAAGRNEDLVEDLGSVYTWIQGLLLKDLEKGGIQSVYDLDLSRSVVLGDNDEIMLKATYRVRFLDGMIPIPAFRLSNQVYMRAWTGGHLAEIQSVENEGASVVFVSEHGYVYHTNPMCSHIHLTIFYVGEEETKDYDPCDKCTDAAADMGETYYITATGNHYHRQLNCSGLKRHIDSVIMTEAQTMGYQPCSRCSGGSE